MHQTGAEGEISRDVGRTFASHSLFQKNSGVGQNMLSNILKACNAVFTDVAYCQGMNFVVASFLMIRLQDHSSTGFVEKLDEEDSIRLGSERGHFCSEDDCYPCISTPNQRHAEEDIFWLMAALIRKQNNNRGNGLSMRGMWLPGCPEFKMRVFQFQTLMEREVPRLLYHLEHVGMLLEIIICQWFLTMFAYSLPMEVLARIWDCIFIDGWKAIFRIGLARLKAVEDIMLNLDAEVCYQTSSSIC